MACSFVVQVRHMLPELEFCIPDLAMACRHLLAALECWPPRESVFVVVPTRLGDILRQPLGGAVGVFGKYQKQLKELAFPNCVRRPKVEAW